MASKVLQNRPETCPQFKLPQNKKGQTSISNFCLREGIPKSYTLGNFTSPTLLRNVCRDKHRHGIAWPYVVKTEVHCTSPIVAQVYGNLEATITDGIEWDLELWEVFTAGTGEKYFMVGNINTWSSGEGVTLSHRKHCFDRKTAWYRRWTHHDLDIVCLTCR